MLSRSSRPSEDRRWTRVAVAACGTLGVVLVLLAVVQYRQLAELRNAERRQLDLSLHATAERFADDFTSELLRVATAFRLERESDTDPLVEQLRDAYEEWLGSAEYPDLVREVLVVRPDDDGRGWRFRNGETGFGVLQEVRPSTLDFLRSPLRRYAQLPGLTAPGSTRPKEAIFMAAIPALAIPFVPRDGAFPAWLVIKLNDELIAESLLPALFDSYFGAARDSPYHFGVVSAQTPESIVFASEHFSLADVNSADVTLGLPWSEDSANELRAARLQSMRILIADGPRWRLAAKHKMGSLDAAVDNLRWRNLLVGAVVLIVLAASGALVIISAGRARRVARMQMELAAAMSHELRNPLAVIRAAAYNLKEGVVADRDGVQRYGGLVQDAGRRLSKVVDQLLLFAETQYNPGKVEAVPVRVSDAVDRALEAVCAALPDRKKHIHSEIPNGLPEALADPVALSHCVQNLVINGIRYGDSSEEKPVRITAVVGSQGREVEIRVSDCGPGIHRKHLRHIFKPFYRANSEPGGTGMGLALVERLMESQGGRISVQTALNAGATFVLHVPVAS